MNDLLTSDGVFEVFNTFSNKILITRLKHPILFEKFEHEGD